MNWLLGGWTALVMLFLYIPIILLVVFSFNSSKLNIRWESFTFRWYSNLLHDRPLRDAMWNSLIIAFFVTILSTVLGTIGAWLLYRYTFPFTRTLNTLVFIPMVVPEVIMGISLRILFREISLPLGFITVIIAHVTFCFPFVMVAVQARLSGLDPSLEEAAQDLGCTPMKAFLKVMVPYLLPAILSGALMSFTLSIDEYIVTNFTNSSDARTFPLLVYGRVRSGLDPSLNAISTLLIVATAVLVVASEWLKKFNK